MTNQTHELLNQSVTKTKTIESKPVFFNLADATDRDRLDELFTSGAVQHVVDDYEEEQLELFGVKNPTLVYTPDFKEKFAAYYYADLARKTAKINVAVVGEDEKDPFWLHGKWVFFLWCSKLVHILPEDDFQLVRTARNKNLINAAEQEKFYNATVGIAGLSVGSSVAYAIVLQGGAKHLKLADMDRLALSNTNRILSGVDNLGVLKVEMAARRIYEINPYVTIELFPEGLQKGNIDRFFDGLNIVIDEIDNLAVKYLIREQAQKRGLAVVMAADNGDNAVVDIDRFDLDKNTPFFHGRMGTTDTGGEITYDMLTKLDKFGIGKMITKMVGAENVTQRMQESLLEMGKTIVSWPQLGGAAMINGTAVAYCVRKILNGQPLESNRALIFLDEKLIPDYNSPAEQERRASAAAGFRKIFGL
jgi:molybdopterin/thiamine biosynthesis adenylyltransferase